MKKKVKRRKKYLVVRGHGHNQVVVDVFTRLKAAEEHVAILNRSTLCHFFRVESL